MNPEEVEYLVCNECESPCYVFELDRKGKVVTAFCQLCGADHPDDFRLPDIEEIEPDE